MDIGLLWFDNDQKRTLEQKVQRAVTHYIQKFGQQPTVCYLNPNSINGSPETVSGVQLRAAKNVLPHHFWIGLEDGAAASSNGSGKARRTRRKK